MAGTNWVKFEIPSDTRNVAFARTAVALFASQLDWTLDELEDIKVAVSKLFPIPSSTATSWAKASSG